MTQSDSSSSGEVREGDVLGGKYRIERVLGMGGMGVVVAAHHIHLDTKVAIKFLLPAMLANREAVSRFAREARAAVRITSEHVARILDVGTLATGAPYMVMEFLEGADLAAWIKERGPLAVEQAIDFVLQACVAVADAHALGIVHRDLKPANLFCVKRTDGQLSIKVLDFGISKVTDIGRGSEPSGVSVTRTSAMMGSPIYMSPEQMRSSKHVGAQTDIWALGVILFELMTGQPPFQGESVTELAIKVASEPAPALTSVRSDIPKGLDPIVARCLEKDPLRRYPNVAELAVALLPFAPARARGSVDRISGIIQASGLSVPTPGVAIPAERLAGTLPAAFSPPASTSVIAPGPSLVSGATVSPTSSTRSRIPKDSPLGVALGVAGAGVLVLLAVGYVASGFHAGPQPTVAASSASVVDGPATAAAAQILVAPHPATTSLDVLVDAAQPVHPAVETAPTPPVALAHTAVPLSQPAPLRAPPSQGPAPPPAPAHAGPTGCDPPFTLDEQGRKHFKPECYLKKSP